MIVNGRLLIDLRNALLALPEDPEEAKAMGFDRSYWATVKKPESPGLGCGTNCCAYGLGTTLPSWKEAGLGLALVCPDPVYYKPSSPEGTTPREVLGLSENQWLEIFGYEPTIEGYCPNDPHIIADKLNHLLQWQET